MSEVFIVGGGVAGLSAAQELKDRGYNVTVFEKNPICGGKARSMDARAPQCGGAAPPPGAPQPIEHGFHFFPGFYRHITDTMGHIYLDAGHTRSVLTNFSEAKKIGIGQINEPVFTLPARSPRTVPEWLEALSLLFRDR